jgi:hypothetical protein
LQTSSPRDSIIPARKQRKPTTQEASDTMATSSQNDTFLTTLGSYLALDTSQDGYTMVAQDVTCAYPISDIYASTPRILYYCLLVLVFATLRYPWLSQIFLTGAVAYAASAAIHAFIIVSTPSKIQPPALVSIPLVSPFSNMTTAITSVVTNATALIVQPDAVELDIDSITAVVVTAYLVGLPLQTWSRTMRSKMIIRYMLLFWNLFMFAGTICALVAWPTTNLTAPQYRFCCNGFMDPESHTSEGWNSSYWQGTWNATISNIFNNPNTVWQNLADNCFYPCFNTSQTIRQSSSLRAVVRTPSTKFAKLHNDNHNTDDEFRPLIYAAITAFSVAQFGLYLVSVLRLESEAMRKPIHEPQHLWRERGKVWRQLSNDILQSWTTVKAVCRWPMKHKHSGAEASYSKVSSPRLEITTILRLVFDIFALLTLLAGVVISPPLVIAFICWIEWYIRNDGATNETIRQVGQWSPLVAVAVILVAAVVYQGRGWLASRTEVLDEIHETELHLRKLRGQLEEKNSR